MVTRTLPRFRSMTPVSSGFKTMARASFRCVQRCVDCLSGTTSMCLCWLIHPSIARYRYPTHQARTVSVGGSNGRALGVADLASKGLPDLYAGASGTWHL